MIQNMRIGGAASQYPPPHRSAAIAILLRCQRAWVDNSLLQSFVNTRFC